MTAAGSTAVRGCGVSLLAALLTSAVAVGAESPDPYAGAAWQDGQKAAVHSALVAVVRVVEAGKAGGAGWDGNFNRTGSHTDWTGDVDLRQEVTVEVTDVLRGKPPAGRLRVSLGKFAMRYRSLQAYWSRHVRDRNKPAAGASIPVDRFALKKDRSYLFFLKAAGAESDAREAAGAPAAGSDAGVIKSVRAFSAVLAVWDSPPKLSPEEDEKVRSMVRQLGAADYKKRAEADRALRDMGHLLRPYLAAAAKDQDLEKATAAERIMRDFAPEPGKQISPRLPDQVTGRLRAPRPERQPDEKASEPPSGGAPDPAR